MALEGLLKDVQLRSVLAVLAKGRKTGAITVIDEGKDGVIYMADGLPVDAKIEDEVGDRALRQLLGWQAGKFFFEENIHGAQETITEGLQREVSGLSPQQAVPVPEEELRTDSETPHDLLEVFHQVLEHSTQGISAVAVVRIQDGDVLACGSLLESDRALVTQASGILKLLENASSDVGRGGLEQITLLDGKGWFVALRLRDELYLVCTAAKRAKLGQLLFHLKRICDWVIQLEL